MGKLGVYIGYLSLALVLGLVRGTPIYTCSQTPYPEACEAALGSITLSAESKSTISFTRLNLNAAFQRVNLVRSRATSIDLSKFDQKTRGAWLDCLELSNETLVNLNRVLDPTKPSSFDDQITWLSASIAGHDTCLNGFVDFGLNSQLSASPFVSSNVSQLLSNSLAVTKANVVSLSGGNRRLLSQGFPSWVSPADRKLLQSPVKANVVVAKDGSGNYRTVSEAAAAASKRSGNGRFVILVKAGVYSENVQISASNVMLVGEGIGRTVITGRKNVQDGSTTFASATVGMFFKFRISSVNYLT